MDKIIRHIIDIDTRASDILARADQRIEEGEKETRAHIEKMKTDIIHDAKLKAKELYESAVSEARAKADTIKASSDEDVKNLEAGFNNIRESLEEKLFMQIIEQGMRVQSE